MFLQLTLLCPVLVKCHSHRDQLLTTWIHLFTITNKLTINKEIFYLQCPLNLNTMFDLTSIKFLDLGCAKELYDFLIFKQRMPDLKIIQT